MKVLPSFYLEVAMGVFVKLVDPLLVLALEGKNHSRRCHGYAQQALVLPTISRYVWCAYSDLFVQSSFGDVTLLPADATLIHGPSEPRVGVDSRPALLPFGCLFLWFDVVFGFQFARGVPLIKTDWRASLLSRR